MEHARRQAPAEIRSLWKAVTKEDYKALAEGFPGIAKAQPLDNNDCSHLPYKRVNLAITPNGGGSPSPLLKQELAAFLETRKVITTEISILDPEYRPISIDAEVFAYASEDEEQVKNRIEDALILFFAFDRMNFGQDIHFSDLVALLDGIPGVSHVDLNLPSEDVIVHHGQIPSLGEINLNVQRLLAST